MENFTAEQKAYHLRKMKTRYARLDVDKDAYITLAGGLNTNMND